MAWRWKLNLACKLAWLQFNKENIGSLSGGPSKIPITFARREKRMRFPTQSRAVSPSTLALGARRTNKSEFCYEIGTSVEEDVAAGIFSSSKSAGSRYTPCQRIAGCR